MRRRVPGRFRGRALGAVPLLLTFSGMSGCFSYAPIDLETVPVGQEVRVHLTQGGMARLRELREQTAGPAIQPVVDGTVAARDADRFSLLIPVTSRQVGFLQSQLGQQVTFGTGEIVAVEGRQVDRLRTGLAVVSGTTALTLVAIGIIKGAIPKTEAPPPGPEDGRAPAPPFTASWLVARLPLGLSIPP